MRIRIRSNNGTLFEMSGAQILAALAYSKAGVSISLPGNYQIEAVASDGRFMSELWTIPAPCGHPPVFDAYGSMSRERKFCYVCGESL